MLSVNIGRDYSHFSFHRSSRSLAEILKASVANYSSLWLRVSATGLVQREPHSWFTAKGHSLPRMPLRTCPGCCSLRSIFHHIIFVDKVYHQIRWDWRRKHLHERNHREFYMTIVCLWKRYLGYFRLWVGNLGTLVRSG